MSALRFFYTLADWNDDDYSKVTFKSICNDEFSLDLRNLRAIQQSCTFKSSTIVSGVGKIDFWLAASTVDDSEKSKLNHLSHRPHQSQATFRNLICYINF